MSTMLLVVEAQRVEGVVSEAVDLESDGDDNSSDGDDNSSDYKRIGPDTKSRTCEKRQTDEQWQKRTAKASQIRSMCTSKPKDAC